MSEQRDTIANRAAPTPNAEPSGEAPAAGEPWFDSNEVSTEELAAKFDRPIRPPAPQPARRASSDGGKFVAHHAIVEPPAPTDTPPPADPVIVDAGLTAPTPEAMADAGLTDDQRSLKRLIQAMPDTAADSGHQFEVPRDNQTTTASLRRRVQPPPAWMLYGACAVIVLLSLLFLGSVRTSSKPPSVAAPAPPPVRSAAIVSRPPPVRTATATATAITPAPSAPPRAVVPPTIVPTPSAEKRPESAPPTRRAKPAAPRSKPPSPNDDSSDTFPDEPRWP